MDQSPHQEIGTGFEQYDLYAHFLFPKAQHLPLVLVVRVLEGFFSGISMKTSLKKLNGRFFPAGRQFLFWFLSIAANGFLQVHLWNDRRFSNVHSEFMSISKL